MARNNDEYSTGINMHIEDSCADNEYCTSAEVLWLHVVISHTVSTS